MPNTKAKLRFSGGVLKSDNNQDHDKINMIRITSQSTTVLEDNAEH